MTAALEGVSGQQHAPAALYPRERPGTHFTGGWVVINYVSVKMKIERHSCGSCFLLCSETFVFLIKLNITQEIEGFLSFCGVVELNVGFSEKIHR
jgi:Pyruvate/2-oxoacid:ferredoxin oxidoreductase delta subunit